jgi:transcriptional regulator with XRE-family HTH domain
MDNHHPKWSPNVFLKRARELRGWSQEHLAQEIGTTHKIVGRWERGESTPTPYYRTKLCVLFGKNAEELGLIEQQAHSPSSHQSLADTMSENRSSSLFGEERYNGAYPPQERITQPSLPEKGEIPAAPAVLLQAHRDLDLLHAATDMSPEQQLGMVLALKANELATFFDEGWSVEELVESLRVVLPGIHVMSKITRRAFGRKVLQFGAAAAVSHIAVPSGRHVSAEDLAKLHNALGESIASGWKLFHTAGNAQVLAVGQAQLYLVQQNHALLYPSVQPLFYSAVYRLLGAALHFQGRYEEAYQAHEKAYIAALEGADAWNMAQSRGWQAYGQRARGNYPQALQMADAALRLISHQMDTESIRLRARLLAFSAENAALLGNEPEVQARLTASEELLGYLPGSHEEFDQVSWLQQAGTCALSLKHYDVAVARLQQALDELPAQWTLRVVSTALPLASALTRTKELERALALVEKTLPTVKASQSPTLVEEFTDYLQSELLASYPYDQRCQTFVAEAQRQLASA